MGLHQLVQRPWCSTRNSGVTVFGDLVFVLVVWQGLKCSPVLHLCIDLDQVDFALILIFGFDLYLVDYSWLCTPGGLRNDEVLGTEPR